MRDTWDASDLGCGHLVFQLHRRIARLSPGDTLELRAEDPGAPADVAAWCRTTGNTLVEAEPPRFVIRREA